MHSQGTTTARLIASAEQVQKEIDVLKKKLSDLNERKRQAVQIGCSRAVEGEPKTRNSYRDVPISAPLMAALRTVRCVSRSPYVCSNCPAPTEPRTVREFYGRLLERLGLPHVRFHGLRHTFATRCIESGADVKTVSTILGHATVGITLDLYVHPDFGQKRKAVAKLNRLLGLA